MAGIPEQHTWRCFFHMTDIRNLDSIIKNGLLSTNKKNAAGIEHKNIANMTIQSRRAEMDVPCGRGGKVHDYVPFYFSSLNPMLLGVLNTKNQDQPFIIYLCLKISKLESLSAVFTDASANTSTPPNFYDNTADLCNLSWDLIDCRKWKYAEENERHRKMAEALIYERVDFSEIDAIVVYNEWVKKDVTKILETAGVTGVRVIYAHELVGFNYNFYYTKFFIKGREHETLVTGPAFLKYNVKECIENILDSRKQPRNSYPYQDIESLVDAVNKKFDSIPELAGIYDLETDNPMHNETVSLHTQHVVNNIKDTTFYQNADTHIKHLLELAAYLHDIGKGPKEKWANQKQPAYPDHPVDAIPMLQRILVEDIQNISNEDIASIVKLVAYHDILGDCMFRDRDLAQIKDAISSEDDLDRLFALSEADIRAIDCFWYKSFMSDKDTYKQQILNIWKQE